MYFHRRSESVRTLRPLRSVNSVVCDHSGTTPAIVSAARCSDLRRTFDSVTNGIELSPVYAIYFELQGKAEQEATDVVPCGPMQSVPYPGQ